MRILHVAPHLGGGVGKAHATLAQTRSALSGRAASREQHSYVLLEPPRDQIYVDLVRGAGCALHICPEPETLAALMAEADIVQVEWWNHPRLYQLLVGSDLPAMRLMFWVHISSLGPPLVPRALVELADKTLFTTPRSLHAPNLRPAIQARPDAYGAVNSGFGFEAVTRPPLLPGMPVRLGYMGTIDFAKMHPDIFDHIDAVDEDLRVSFWGKHDPAGEVAQHAASMRHPERVRFEGYASDPAAVLGNLDALVYLLAPGHYGTAENVLVEAMSLGVVPIVWNNLAETAIVRDRKTGHVVNSQGEFAARLREIINDPRRLQPLSAAASRDMGLLRSPKASVRNFGRAYRLVLKEPKQRRDFEAALGSDSRAWFMSSLTDSSDSIAFSDRMLSGMTSKGSLGHFRLCSEDQSLAAFAQA